MGILASYTHFPGPLVCRIRKVPLYFMIRFQHDMYLPEWDDLWHKELWTHIKELWTHIIKLIDLSLHRFYGWISIQVHTPLKKISYYSFSSGLGIRDVVFNATFNNISVILWRSVLLMMETGEHHRPVASHW